MCAVCQREAAYEAGRVNACQKTRPYHAMYQDRIGTSAVEEMLTEAFMLGAEWKQKGGAQ